MIAYCEDEKNVHWKQIIDDIIFANEWLTNFWSNSEGWAPSSVASLLNSLNFDSWNSLSKSLNNWIDIEETRGDLILAWVNLGSLVEGTIKIFLCVYYEDYYSEIKKAIEEGKRFYKQYHESKNIYPPEKLGLFQIRKLLKRNGVLTDEFDKFMETVTTNRNAIHAFKDIKIGDKYSFFSFLIKYLKFIKEFNLNLPYPDEVAMPLLKNMTFKFNDLLNESIEEVGFYTLRKLIVPNGTIYSANINIGKNVRVGAYTLREVCDNGWGFIGVEKYSYVKINGIDNVS